MIPQTKAPKSFSEQEIDAFLEESSKTIEESKQVRAALKQTVQDLTTPDKAFEIEITGNYTLNCLMGFAQGAIVGATAFYSFQFLKNFWNSRNSAHLPSNEGNKPLQGEEMMSNSSAPQKSAVSGNESPQIIQQPAVVQSEKATPSSGDGSSIATSLPSLDPTFKEVPGPDSMFSSMKKDLMCARETAGLGAAGEKDRMSLKELLGCMKLTIEDPKKARKEYSRNVRRACNIGITKLETFFKDIDPNIDSRSALQAVLSEASKGKNSEDCLKKAAGSAIGILNKNCGQFQNGSLELTNLLPFNYSENNDRNREYSECSPLGRPVCSNLSSNPNNGQNRDPIPNVSQGGATSPNSDSLLSKSLQGAGELGLAGIQASMAAASAKSGDWCSAGITAWEASKNAVNGVSHLAPGVGAAVSSYGDAMNQVDVYGERFDPYSGSNNFSAGDNSYTSDSFDYASSRGLFDRDNDPNSGWPEK